MKDTTKKQLRKSIKLAKKLANSNSHTKKLAQTTRRALVSVIGTGPERELYNLSSFYPSIQDYYLQTQDSKSGDPLISILMPTYNTPEDYLRECIESIIVQSYKHWELCIADDNSADSNVVAVIKEYQKNDKRIKLVERSQNGHISEATNSALDIAKGEFVALMDHDDVLWPNALYEMVQVMRANKNVDFIYSDEDKIDGTGKIHSYPFLKPDFSPEFLESCNYITHFSCIRTSVMHEVGGFRKGYEGAQDWDLFVRITEKTDAVIHIPKILYSWRIHAASTASDTDAKPYVYEAQKKLLVDHVERGGIAGTVETGIIVQHRTVKYAVKDDELLSVFVLYKSVATAKRLVTSLLNQNAGMSFEIFYLNPKGQSKKTEAELRSVAPEITQEFIQLESNSASEKYKVALAKSNGEYILFVKDTVEVVSEDWARRLVGDCQIPGVGIVGPVLLDTTRENIFSAGLGLGYGQNGSLDMLRGTPFDDPHYTRGLYAKSRRNVSAVNDSFFGIAKSKLAYADLGQDIENVIGLCVDLSKKKYRHVYTPYVQAVDYEAQPDLEFSTEFVDPYLNPNFNHSNPRMEVRP